MSKMPLQDQVLHALRKKKVPVYIYLMSGIKLDGCIEDFDQFVVILKNRSMSMLYKHAISTILPQQATPLKDLLAEVAKEESA